MSDESDYEPRHKRKRNLNQLLESSSDSDCSSIIIGTNRRRKKKVTNKISIGRESDSDNSSVILQRPRKKLTRVNSSQSSSSGSEIMVNRRRGRILSDSDSDGNSSDRDFEGGTSTQWETDFSYSESEVPKPVESVNTTAEVQDIGVQSDSSDGQSEKCPICLLSFKAQEIASPESCDHIFCAECIHEWSKNMNTCPVDRQKFTLILVRKCIDGKVIRQIPIQPPAPQNEIEIIEDPTFCELCGSSDREERMLLCDGCDLGFHLECLTPPLDDVPAGAWYCPNCSPLDDELGLFLFLDDEFMRQDGGRRRISSSPRIIPRTQQSERVRNRIRNNRNRNSSNSLNELLEPPSTSGLDDSNHPVQQVTSSTRSVKTRKKPKQQRRRGRTRRTGRRTYRTIYGVDEATGETVVVEKVRYKKSKRSGRSRATPNSRRANRRERARQVAAPKTAKRRIARHLGICASRTVPESLPDMKMQVTSSNGGINHQRHQAGIPTLHLFGNRDDLDYFSPSEDEAEHISSGGLGVMTRRPSNRSDVSILQRIARRKAAMISSVSSSTDILGSILDTQARFHSKNTTFSLDKDGKFKMNNNKDSKICVTDSKNNINLNDYSKLVRKKPGYSEADNSTPSSTVRRDNDYQHTTRQSYGSSLLPKPLYGPLPGLSYSRSNENFDLPQDYSQRTLCAAYEYQPEENKKDNKDNRERNSDNNTPGSNTPHSESEVDIYSDIENDAVSTSRLEDFYLKPPPTPPILRTPEPHTDEENDRDSEADMVIDTEKADPEKYDPIAACNSDDEELEEDNIKEALVTSTVDSTVEEKEVASTSKDEEEPCASSEIQSQAIQSSDQTYEQQNSAQDLEEQENEKDDDLDSEDGCPNFSIYSKESINMAKTTEVSLVQESNDNNDTTEENHLAEETDVLESAEHIEENDQVGEVSSTPKPLAEKNEWEDDEEDITEKVVPPCDDEKIEKEYRNPSRDGSPVTTLDIPSVSRFVVKRKQANLGGGLYSDSEDESVVKKDDISKFVLSDLRNMTEDISEEERSYTPENKSRYKGGLEDLDTELISDEDRNDFDESHELKTQSDGDALEINAKESELDFTRPEEYEEGEIVDKSKSKKGSENELEEEKSNEEENPPESSSKPDDEHEHEHVEDETEKNADKEDETVTRDASFKKLSRSNKERNYRDRDKENRRSRSRDKSKFERERQRRKDKRKEIERYDVRALIAEKPRRLKDKFGRDIRQTPSRSRSKSLTPPVLQRRSLSLGHGSMTRRIGRIRSRDRSKDRRSKSRSRSRSHGRKRSRSKTKKRRRSHSRPRERRRKSRDRRKKTKKVRSHSRQGSPPPPPLQKRRRGRELRRPSREWSRSLSPSWTPPHVSEAMQQNLTVILPNDAGRKKKEKRKRGDKRSGERQRKKRRSDRTPPPSKEVFASGDNILVSVSFNKENEIRDISTARKKQKEEEIARRRREKRRRLAQKNLDISGVKPVAVIDLERSPFREITSPKDVIVLTDSDNDANELGNNEVRICDSSQQVASPERCVNSYTTGPKTPPEPQIKFSLNSKQPQLRVITNPLGDVDELENEIDIQEELEERLNESIYKGPNTPPEPPNSPPSSPDAYDPFEPTKSRSPTPEPLAINPPNESVIPIEETREDSILIESIRTGISEIMDNKGTAPVIVIKTPDALKSSLTPPVADIQPADSQSSIHPATPDSNIGKSPDLSLSLSQPTQPMTPTYTPVSSKPVAQTTPFSSVPTSIITSTPVSTSLAPPRINILNNTIITPSIIASSIPPRIVLPSTVKSSPVKISPTKPTIKSTPIKPMPSKSVLSKPQRKTTTTTNRTQNGNEVSDLLDFDSPYSPGSSDYEDLFEPPPELTTKTKTKPATKSPAKIQSIFDVLFGSGSMNKTGKQNKSNEKSSSKYKKIAVTPTKGSKLVGVKLDEDSLKILDDLPSSAVEMQVKDKFLKKLNRQERVVEEVKLVLKPYYNKKRITKEEYKDIMRRAVPKICHNKTGEINPTKIKNLVEAYVKKIRHNKKVTSSSSFNPQKV